MKVVVDKDKCIMAGECYYNHPELFQMEEDGMPVVLLDEVASEDEVKHAEEAIEVCPSGAISFSG